LAVVAYITAGGRQPTPAILHVLHAKACNILYNDSLFFGYSV